MQGALFATMNAGTDLARDIQTGFLNRLALTPMRGIALLGGQLGGVIGVGRRPGRRLPRRRPDRSASDFAAGVGGDRSCCSSSRS